MDGDAGMRGWLTTLERARDDIRRTLEQLTADYEAERVFSHDAHDLDYDADVLHCTRTGPPVLDALDSAITAVTEILGRKRG